jgi:prepilin-type N-terminal cleavage/methylation domain-containing protein
MLRKLHKEEKGFTLVELMIVVVILGILVAIAVPIFNKVTGDAEYRAMQANARTIEGVLVQIQAATGVPLTQVTIDDTGILTLAGTLNSIAASMNGDALDNSSGDAYYFKAWPQYKGAGFKVVNGIVQASVSGTYTDVTSISP